MFGTHLHDWAVIGGVEGQRMRHRQLSRAHTFRLLPRTSYQHVFVCMPGTDYRLLYVFCMYVGRNARQATCTCR